MCHHQEQCSYKRVVLLFKLHHDDDDIINAFLRYCGHPESEYAENKHYMHLDPMRWELPAETYLAHIVIDFNEANVESPDLASLPHEIYKVKLDNTNNL
jgi:hypothetical protein